MDRLGAFSVELVGASPLATKLWRAAERRRSVTHHTDAIRLHDAYSDAACGATIECFGPWAVVNLYDPEEQPQAIAAAMMNLGAKGVYVKRRARTDLRRSSRAELAPSRPVLGAAAPSSHRVSEHGLKFIVRLNDGLSTGLFLDQRVNRVQLRRECAGARVLNLFCYTGAFSIAAAAGGAALTTSVDLSGAVLRRLSENVGLNQQKQAAHRVLKADAVKWLKRAVRRGDQYDYIVLDPPSFSSDGPGTFSVTKNYLGMAADCLRILPPSGKLLAVTNHRKTSTGEFDRLLREAALSAGCGVQLRAGELPLDCAPPRVAEAQTKSTWVTKL